MGKAISFIAAPCFNRFVKRQTDIELDTSVSIYLEEI